MSKKLFDFLAVLGGLILLGIVLKAIFDPNENAYRCPTCNLVLKKNQTPCPRCHTVIDWSGLDG